MSEGVREPDDREIGQIIEDEISRLENELEPKIKKASELELKRQREPTLEDMWYKAPIYVLKIIGGDIVAEVHVNDGIGEYNPTGITPIILWRPLKVNYAETPQGTTVVYLTQWALGHLYKNADFHNVNPSMIVSWDKASEEMQHMYYHNLEAFEQMEKLMEDERKFQAEQKKLGNLKVPEQPKPAFQVANNTPEQVATNLVSSNSKVALSLDDFEQTFKRLKAGKLN